MAPPVKKPPKPIFKISSPFTETRWPSVSHEDEEVVTELLCNLLTPLGEHRRTHVQPSKGKKRKRDTRLHAHENPRPSPPAIGFHLLVGLNSVTRHLEALATRTAPPNAPTRESGASDKDGSATENETEKQLETTLRPLSMVILTHPRPSLSPSHAHIPTLLHLATLQPRPGSKTSAPTRLVALPTSNDARFASALHIPRVGAIGIYEGAPGANALEEYVRQHVGATECPWVDEALKPEWRGLTVKQD
ncbi:Ribonuclease P [Ascochyta rabiei]|uniref:Uncharacterized protein n=1 Tax=Didymella rabiei TaxID=5454 RepID=A0A163K728_DIDRA|nr:Ribonuclease P [Ascochyta rabiei]KZM26817.1 hypothetical protein ST47_g2037 [Ascochyta rabiei]UPX21085.1 Ribonuclease P [Ascochyta rabiei]